MSNVVLASYFNYTKDPQRDTYWSSDYSDLLLLISSVIQFNIEIKIFHNCFESIPTIRNCEWIRVDPDHNYVPTVFRHFVYKNYLKNNHFSKIFMVDSTDVMMLKNPFSYMNSEIIYVGEEKKKFVSNKWMRKEQSIYLKNLTDYEKIIEDNKDRTLLNAGVIGGDYSTIINFLNLSTYYHSNNSKGLSRSTDMAIFNYVVHKHFLESVHHGDTVTTEFKKYLYSNESWWKHK